MLIASTNQLSSNTFTLDTGTGLSGDVENLKTSDFSANFTSSSNPYIVDCGVLTSGLYVAVLGIGRGSKTDVTISLGMGASTNIVQSVVLPYYYRNAVFKFDTETTARVYIKVESSTSTTLSCVMGGQTVTVPNNGVVGSQVFPALQNNYQTSNTSDVNSSPTNHIIRRIAPTVTLSFPNILRSWLESNMFDVYNLSNEFGLVPMLEFEDADNYEPYRSWCAFGLQPTKTNLDSRTNKLVSISLPFKASV